MAQEKLSIIVPVCNEGGSIPALYRSLTAVCRENGYDYEIIFVDDGSADGTLDLLKELRRNDPLCRYLSLKRNFGQSAALAAGFDAAKGAYLATLDGDGQNDPADIPRLLEKCREGFDLVNGWRRRRRDPFFSRRLPSFFANLLIRRLTGVKIHDTGCTLKVFRKDVLEGLHLYGENHRFIPALLHWAGARITETEVGHFPRKHGRSKYTFSRLPRVILDLVNIKFLISYSTRPIQIFGKMGFYSLFTGLLSLLALIYMKISWGVDMTGNPFLMLTVLLCFLGVQFITMGLLGEINIRIYHESTRRKIYSIAERSD